jgi:S-layer homology domain
MKRSLPGRFALVLTVALCAVFAGGASRIVQDQCGPFTDVTPGFCPYILEIYYLGVTVGTSATTFSPDEPLTRGQGAVFVAKGIDQALARSSRRAALGQWWTTTPSYDLDLGVVTVGNHPIGIASDGADLWVANQFDGTVWRVRASDGKLLETWTDATNATCILVAMGRIFVTSADGPLLMIDPSQPPGPVTNVGFVGVTPAGIAFDGSRIWVANNGGSISIVTPSPSLPWSTTNVKTGFSTPEGALFDGTNVWITDYQAGTLLRLDGNGAILQTVPVGTGTGFMAYDGENIWVPSWFDDTVTVVRASTGELVKTLSGLPASPASVAFDGQRMLVVSYNGFAVSLFKAADFTPLGTLATGDASFPYIACSDGRDFWLSLSNAGRIARF